MVKEVKRLFSLQNKGNSEFVLYLILILFFLEPISIFFNEVLSISYRIKAVYKIILLIVLLIVSLKYSRNIWRFRLGISLAICFIIGQLALPSHISIFGSNFYNELISGDLYIAIKFLFIIFFVAAYEVIPNNTLITRKVVNFFGWFMVFNTLAIFLGVVTKWECLRTYPFSERFGFIGIIELAGESIHFYTLAITLAYIKYIKTKKNGWIVILLSIVGLFLGKKAIVLFIFLLLIIYLIYFKRKFILATIFAITALGVIYFKIIFESIFLKLFPFWNRLYEDKGIVTVIFSLRDYLLNSALDYINENWNALNFLFGGIDYFNYRSEFGFFDLFLAFGLIGFSIYLIYLYRYIFLNQTLIVKVVFIIILLIDAVSGGLIINVFPSILLYLIAKYFKESLFNDEQNKNILNSNSSSR